MERWLLYWVICFIWGAWIGKVCYNRLSTFATGVLAASVAMISAIVLMHFNILPLNFGVN
jgi:hypothetical protein